MSVALLAVALLMSAPSDDPSGRAEISVDQEQRAFRLGKKIRCPVCQGMPISESPAQAAQDMMAQLRRLVAEQKSDREIIDWFEARYGEWAILEPSREGFNLLVWLLPGVAFFVALGFWLSRVRGSPPHRVDPSSAAEVADDKEDNDPYLRALRDEVEA